ncbi:MAG: F0F1 ATP synthase subunit delta [Solirubrobacterales bacterium]
MLNKSVARRYAEAFFAIAQEQNKIDEYLNELETVFGTISADEEFSRFMNYLLIPPADKKDVLNKVFEGKVSVSTLNFARLVIDKRRAAYFGVILNEYKSMADEVNNVIKADFISAKPVSGDDIAELEKALSEATGKNVKINTSVDPALLGGVKIRVGDRIIDASVVKKLQMLKTSLKNTKIS